MMTEVGQPADSDLGVKLDSPPRESCGVSIQLADCWRNVMAARAVGSRRAGLTLIRASAYRWPVGTFVDFSHALRLRMPRVPTCCVQMYCRRDHAR